MKKKKIERASRHDQQQRRISTCILRRTQSIRFQELKIRQRTSYEIFMKRKNNLNENIKRVSTTNNTTAMLTESMLEFVFYFTFNIECIFSTIIPVERKLGQPLNSLILTNASEVVRSLWTNSYWRTAFQHSLIYTERKQVGFGNCTKLSSLKFVFLENSETFFRRQSQFGWRNFCAIISFSVLKPSSYSSLTPTNAFSLLTIRHLALRSRRFSYLINFQVRFK